MSVSVEFYLLNEPRRELAACRLCEQVYQQQLHTLLLCEDAALVKSVNELLWTFREDSFIPHFCLEEKIDLKPAIVISDTLVDNEFDCLINLSHHAIDSTRFSKIIELVSSDEHIKQRSREHYRFYQRNGYTINTHHMQ